MSGFVIAFSVILRLLAAVMLSFAVCLIAIAPPKDQDFPPYMTGRRFFGALAFAFFAIVAAYLAGSVEP